MSEILKNQQDEQLPDASSLSTQPSTTQSLAISLTPPASASPPTQSANKGHSGLKQIGFALLASYRRAGALFPILASVITLALYFSPGLPLPLLSGTSNLYAPLYGLVITVIAVFAYANISLPFTISNSGLGMQDYNLLKSSQYELRARLGIVGDPRKNYPDNEMIQMINIPAIHFEQDRYKLTALREAYSAYFALYKCLHSVSLLRPLDSGDVYAWGLIHRIEEALIEIEPPPIVVREAMRDQAAIQDSAIDNRDELLKRLLLAVADLDKGVIEYFNDSQCDKKLTDILEEMQALGEAFLKHQTKKATNTNNQNTVSAGKKLTTIKENNPKSQSCMQTQDRARAALRQIKHSLNEFREQRLTGLIQARNNLVLATVASGIITYLLLCLFIVGKINSNSIAAFATFYIIGVAAGLFGRLYAESNKESAINDYGLSRARLQAIPLISGLAAIGGVFITLATFPIGEQTNAGIIILSASDPRLLLAAIIFGFTPNLLIKSLQQRSDKYASDLESTKGK